MQDLFETVRVGAVEAKNRVFMAPLTRNRADNDTDIPSPLAVEYYRQRASAGLIISEATQISAVGKGYVSTPGIYTDAQVQAWREITDAVHAAGGRIFLQLWHVGRISHTSLQPGGGSPVAPSAIQAMAQTYNQHGPVDVSMPRALSVGEIAGIVEDYRHAAQNAKQAGFDGVEVHGANGYLIDQFLRDKTNQRTDEYGGSVENRARFLFEVLDAVTEVFGAERVGLRLSPMGTFNDMADSDPLRLFGNVITRLNDYGPDDAGLAYLHMVERFPGIESSEAEIKLVEMLRARWRGFYIANGDYDGEQGLAVIRSGHADAVAFGRPFISNPDLPERLETGAALADWDEATFYGGGAEGYTDYPALSAEAAV